ncbi:hypothetical protein CWR48_12400 [Oceanobacillus arenosus]|uniref:Uncharacterized protein n=1 Tax=Oceanobacillus arenosus TaxID=1229153 RepID=A0A3D8PSV5_9BACI|nr:hypothetical protein [Oceanobacillus arenosus]RDW18371.1 hypothetical protein CWR48_12400 [Oceanobacillus arenosus]
MEQVTILKEVLNAFKLHAVHIDEKMDKIKIELESKMDNGFVQVGQQFDRLGKKVVGVRVELTET